MISERNFPGISGKIPGERNANLSLNDRNEEVFITTGKKST